MTPTTLIILTLGAVILLLAWWLATDEDKPTEIRPMTMKVLSAEGFASLSPYAKGYAVYMFGCREDQPNVPEKYEPSEEDLAEYERGQARAVLDVQDSEE